MKKLLISIVLILLAVGIRYIHSFNSCGEISFFDVGQGDSFLIQSSDHQTQVLIDGGPEYIVLDELGKVMPSWDKEIELIILTHPHADHLNGLISVVKRFNVNEVWLTGVAFKSSAYKSFLDILVEEGVEVTYVNRGYSWNESDIGINLLGPDQSYLGATYIPENINNTSLVGIIELNQVSLLFTGDAELEQEVELLKHSDYYAIDIMQAGHHGSRTSNSPELVNHFLPRYAIIQAGIDNSYKHPHQETLQTFKRIGSKILRTDIEGTIMLSVCKPGEISRVSTENKFKK